VEYIDYDAKHIITRMLTTLEKS